MNDPCEICLNNVQDEYGSWYCAQGGCLDERDGPLSFPQHGRLPVL